MRGRGGWGGGRLRRGGEVEARRVGRLGEVAAGEARLEGSEDGKERPQIAGTHPPSTVSTLG